MTELADYPQFSTETRYVVSRLEGDTESTFHGHWVLDSSTGKWDGYETYEEALAIAKNPLRRSSTRYDRPWDPRKITKVVTTSTDIYRTDKQ